MNDKSIKCWCGSGKPQRKCHRDKKPRLTQLEFRTADPMSAAAQLKVAANRREAELSDNGLPLHPEKSFTRLSYGKRETLVVPHPPGKMFLDRHDAIMDFDLVMAVDTNTIEVGDVSVSVTCVVLFEVIKTWGLVQRDQMVYEFRDAHPGESPERIGWWLALSKMKEWPPGTRIGVVVDHDKNAHDDITDRKVPIRADFFSS